MKAKEINDRIDVLESRISTNEFWLEKTSNPMKARRRKQEIKFDKAEIKELRSMLFRMKQDGTLSTPNTPTI